MTHFDAAAVVFVGWTPFASPAARYHDTLRTLRSAHPDIEIVVAHAHGTDVRQLSDLCDQQIETGSLAAAVDAVYHDGIRHVLAIADGVSFPPGALDTALEAVNADVRVASVSFWSNAAGPASFPHLAAASLQPPAGFDAATLTARLRAATPQLQPVPVLLAMGGAVLFSASGLSATGSLTDSTGHADEIFADFGLRARARGLVNLLDPSTYLMRSADTSEPGAGHLSAGAAHGLQSQHPTLAAHLDADVTDPSSPLRLSHHRARTVIDGLRVLVDGMTIGPTENGTQVQSLALINALADRPEVSAVAVAVPGDIPAYARPFLDHPKVRTTVADIADSAAFGPRDIIHRPFQPGSPIDFAALRSVETRVVVTMQDLIAYRTGSYFPSHADWDSYRRSIRAAMRGADAVVAISQDVIHAIHDEALPVEDSRLFRVPNGTDHLPVDAPQRCPSALIDLGVIAAPFVLVLGTTYAHKQRDLAIRAARQLADRGRAISCVLVGAQVPVGSSRQAESAARFVGEAVIELPDVTSEERTWLLSHAEVLVYPTAAEGFGLVPFEAARLDTPTVALDFGPLREVAGGPPVAPLSWDPVHLADAIDSLLTNSDLRREQVSHTRNAGRSYTWASTAEKLVAVYAEVLRRPLRTG